MEKQKSDAPIRQPGFWWALGAQAAVALLFCFAIWASGTIY
jgi:hypothetical protein